MIPLTWGTVDNFDEYESGDEETQEYINKEVEEHEKEADKYPQGRPGTLLNRMISHGNKKTEEQLAKDAEERAKMAHNQTTIASDRTR